MQSADNCPVHVIPAPAGPNVLGTWGRCGLPPEALESLALTSKWSLDVTSPRICIPRKAGEFITLGQGFTLPTSLRIDKFCFEMASLLSGAALTGKVRFLRRRLSIYIHVVQTLQL